VILPNDVPALLPPSPEISSAEGLGDRDGSEVGWAMPVGLLLLLLLLPLLPSWLLFEPNPHVKSHPEEELEVANKQDSHCWIWY
jgi:hypothetical protein